MSDVQFSCQSGYLECGIDTVECGGSDASGVAGSFTARIEERRGDRLESIGIARDTNGATAAALYTEDDGIVGKEARVFAVKIAEALLKAFTDMRR